MLMVAPRLQTKRRTEVGTSPVAAMESSVIGRVAALEAEENAKKI